MDGSVYTPGAGHSPRVLAGRDALLHDFELMLNSVSVEGRVRAQDIILSGPRGVGKTVTVTAYGTLAASTGYEVVNLQAVTGQAGLVDSLLYRASSKVQAGAGPWQRAKNAFNLLAGVNLGAAGFTAGITTHPKDSRAPGLEPWPRRWLRWPPPSAKTSRTAAYSSRSTSSKSPLPPTLPCLRQRCTDSMSTTRRLSWSSPARVFPTHPKRFVKPG